MSVSTDAETSDDSVAEPATQSNVRQCWKGMSVSSDAVTSDDSVAEPANQRNVRQCCKVQPTVC